MVSYKLSMTIFAKIILLTVAFRAIFAYICALAARTIKSYFSFHTSKYIPFLLPFHFLRHHTFQDTTKMIKQSNFNPYPNEMLPTGFIYPEHYLKLAKSTDNINYDEEYVFPWWFENSDKNINEIINIYKEITGLPNLLPFARNGTWSACFDFLDHSGNPKVIVIDLDNTENYEIFNNFDEWLKEAENDGW